MAPRVCLDQDPGSQRGVNMSDGARLNQSRLPDVKGMLTSVAISENVTSTLLFHHTLLIISVQFLNILNQNSDHTVSYKLLL